MRAGVSGMAALGVGLAAGLAGAASLPGPAVTMPALSEAGQRGEAAFATHCARCHGADAGGTNAGPPLVHRLYQPGHHADMAFVLAARRGARAHHWSFGNMPPVEGVSDAEILDIIAFVRAVQRANGVF